jgi:hypothetical protein
MKSLRHTFAHLLRWNVGKVVSCYDASGNLWMAFRCEDCGRISHKELNSFCHPAPPDEKFRQ